MRIGTIFYDCNFLIHMKLISHNLFFQYLLGDSSKILRGKIQGGEHLGGLPVPCIFRWSFSMQQLISSRESKNVSNTSAQNRRVNYTTQD